MILPDVNLLLYAYDTSSPSHERARLWWERVLSGREPVRLAWVTILGFVRIGTHSRVFARPMSVAEALAHVESWLAQAVVDVIQPGPRHWAILSELLRQARVAANLTRDAHLAALALEYGATVFSSDTDFRRFSGLRAENPLED
ncbi:MAG: type II toxin-antitoxin system VapC family toxin [Polyangiaceae bacterium]|nr:type II toxin-antitoxin system VapC family toxin [Polyangiaceae bacterium]